MPLPSPAPSPLPSPAPAPPTAEPLGRYLAVRALEFSYTLSRPVVAAGTVTFELRNDGEDPHDLRVRPKAGGQELVAFGETPPGARPTQSASLAAGQYYLWCSLDGHEAAGMHATLRVE